MSSDQSTNLVPAESSRQTQQKDHKWIIEILRHFSEMAVEIFNLI